MAASFVIVPQWQGSGSARAMRLIDGAQAIRGDLPSSATIDVDVPPGAGESLESGVHRLTSIATVAERLDEALAGAPGVPIVIGGDCGIELAAVRRAAGASDEPTALVWFDAHADANTPESSPSGAFHGMVVRALLGDGPDRLVTGPALTPDLLVLAGTRALDDAEADYVDSAGIRVVAPQQGFADAVVDAVRATGATRVYVHVDLDVLDPAQIHGVQFPEPFGVSVAELTEAIRGVRDAAQLVGAGITEFAPADPSEAVEDLPAILRIVSALVR
ncbi:arginase family protein [Cnuibacter physcomitrellae]|uniref:arginase family protein n=1 Tax=Cnuibacter physcomitrellae TaxID=1619308 RepID=UPI002175AC58|nr:arginase family protein [Cnuibacter physcomitrellae]MCS5496702.1 arginase family protein [Cnuibacter physcomitrellae]